MGVMVDLHDGRSSSPLYKGSLNPEPTNLRDVHLSVSKVSLKVWDPHTRRTVQSTAPVNLWFPVETQRPLLLHAVNYTHHQVDISDLLKSFQSFLSSYCNEILKIKLGEKNLNLFIMWNVFISYRSELMTKKLHKVSLFYTLQQRIFCDLKT